MGASISKGIYSLKNFDDDPGVNLDETESSFLTEIYSMYMESEMITVPEKMIVQDINVFNSNIPEHLAWIKLKGRDTNVAVFGFLAKKFQAMKQNQIYSVKYENALGKCLVFVGAIIKKHSLDPLNVSVSVNLLIPYDEFKSSKIIEKNLQKSLKSFYFQGMAIKSKLVGFKCFPEGYGGFINRVDLYGLNWLKEKKIAVLMIGHRNCTCLIFEQGNLLHGETIRSGFFDLIKDIQNNSIGQNTKDLEFLVPKISRDLSKSSEILSCLIKANNQENQKNELEKIKTAINNSREKFWNLLSNWLEGQIPSYLNEIMIFGGASQYFQPELEQYYSWIDIDWAVDTANEIQDLLFSEMTNNDKLPYRFIDAFGLHKHMSKINN
jgi:hypothetical protein